MANFPALNGAPGGLNTPGPRPIDPARPQWRCPAGRLRADAHVHALAESPVNAVDVSVCIANWNCRDVLRDCLLSLLRQPQGVSLEVIVVDNASTDGAADMVRRDFPEVILHLNSANLGFSRANNQAAELSRGRYLLFLNNDTLVPPNTLRRLLDYCADHPRVGMVGPRLKGADGHPQVSYRHQPGLGTLLHRTLLLRWTGLFRDSYVRYRRRDFDPHTVRPVDILMGAAMFLPREVAFTCGLWDEDFTFGGEDLEFSVRVRRHYQVVYLPTVEITHLGRVSTRRHIGFASTQMAVGFARYLRKSGYGPAALTLYKLLVTLDAPVQLAAKTAQYLGRTLRGRSDRADKTLLAVRGLAYFLTRGLPDFWRA